MNLGELTSSGSSSKSEEVVGFYGGLTNLNRRNWRPFVVGKLPTASKKKFERGVQWQCFNGSESATVFLLRGHVS